MTFRFIESLSNRRRQQQEKLADKGLDDVEEALKAENGPKSVSAPATPVSTPVGGGFRQGMPAPAAPVGGRLRHGKSAIAAPLGSRFRQGMPAPAAPVEGRLKIG